MTCPIYTVDAFSDRPFAGNPAAVCLPPTPLDERTLQHIAAEMNLPETAFLAERHDGDWDLRWFTPTVEVKLCGHATLAAAHVLWQERHRPRDRPLRFHTRSGVLSADSTGETLWLDFPATATTPLAAAMAPPALDKMLGTSALAWWQAGEDILAEVADPETLQALSPDLRELARLPARGLIVTAAGGIEDVDFSSRFFAPSVGIDEDPVTGSAHCALAVYWAGRLGKQQLAAHQASPRGGFVTLELQDDRVRLGGQAITVMRGELAL